MRPPTAASLQRLACTLWLFCARLLDGLSAAAAADCPADLANTNFNGADHRQVKTESSNSELFLDNTS